VRCAGRGAAVQDSGRHVSGTVQALRRASWMTGYWGVVLTVLLSSRLSEWTFGTRGHSAAIAILGLTLLLNALGSAESAVIRGCRRIRDLAKLQVASSVAGLVASACLYAWLESVAFCQFFLLSRSRIFWLLCITPARSLCRRYRALVLNLRELLRSAGWDCLYGQRNPHRCVSLTSRSLIISELGIEASGQYQAAWNLSGCLLDSY